MEQSVKDGQEEELERILKEKSIDNYCKSALTFLKRGQSTLNDLKGWQYYTDYPGVQKTMKRVNALVADLIGKVFNHNDIQLKLQGSTLLNKLEIMREGNDALFEKINSNLDEALGTGRNPGIEIVDTTVRIIRGPVNPETGRVMVLHASRNVQKPQLFFTEKINNSAKELFIPLVKEKPHSLKPLAVLLCVDGHQREYHSHPYEYELHHWSPSKSLLGKKEPSLPLPMSKTPFRLVDDVNGLNELLNVLKESSEIGVDLENHSFRSYQGLTCLMQISTRHEDFIVDTLSLRGHLTILNEVFADPKITKVFHGANSDILWLQRDCGVYVVNMFDTHQAASVLNYPHRSLSALLMKFCTIQADKSYQRSDWRIRPLPEDFIEYARMDSHYLLYIYDCIRNELLEKGNKLKNLLHTTYNRSIEICLMRYEKPIITPDSHLELYRKSRKTFNSRQLYALKALYHWRDKMAREHDESVDYILPQHMLLQIAEVLPKEMQGILACCNPIPTLVKMEQLTLHQIMQQARVQPLIEIEKNLAQIVSQEAISTIYELSSELLRKHDLSQVDENPSDLSTLLSGEETLFGDLFTQSCVQARLKEHSHLLGNFKSVASASETLESKLTEDFMSPYQRYSAYLELQPFLDERRKKDVPVATQERIQNIMGHISSLTGQPENEPGISSSPPSDSNRINRIFGHLATLKEENESPVDANSSSQTHSAVTDRVERLQEHIKSLSSELSSHQMEKSLPKAEEGPPMQENKERKAFKKKMSIKELRAQKEAERQPSSSLDAFNPPEERGEKRKSLEAAPNPKRKRKNRRRRSKALPRATPQGEPEVVPKASALPAAEEAKTFQPFNYELADYGMFKKKNNKKSNRWTNQVKERFKGKKSNRKPGFQKSGPQSLTWGGATTTKMPPPF